MVTLGMTGIETLGQRAEVTSATQPAEIGTAIEVSGNQVSILLFCQTLRQLLDRILTGVRSLEPSSSVALVAASIKSSHRFPYSAAALGSAENAFLSPLCLLLRSFDFRRSCFAIRAC